MNFILKYLIPTFFLCHCTASSPTTTTTTKKWKQFPKCIRPFPEIKSPPRFTRTHTHTRASARDTYILPFSAFPSSTPSRPLILANVCMPLCMTGVLIAPFGRQCFCWSVCCAVMFVVWKERRWVDGQIRKIERMKRMDARVARGDWGVFEGEGRGGGMLCGWL